MFGKFRKYQKWIWLVGVIVIIPSFVVFFSPDVDFNRPSGGSSYNFGTIGGKPITQQEYLPVYNEARISYFMRSGGRWPGSDEATQQRVESDAYSRLLLSRKMEEYGIEVSDMTVARMAQRQLGGMDVSRFITDFLRPQGLSEIDYINFLRHEAGIQQLINVAGISGKLVNPREAEVLFRREYESIVTDAAVFWVSNYVDQVAVTPEKVEQYYTNRFQTYREPDQIQVSYVAFMATNYLDTADQQIASLTNFNERVDELYLQRGADAFKDTNGVALTVEAAKEQLRGEFREAFALQEAEREANRFGSALLELPQPNKAEDLEQMAAAKGLTLQVTEPFSRTDTLEGTGLPPAFRMQAFRLAPGAPLSVQPVVSTNGAFILALKNEIKGEVPPLDEIRDKVTEDYQNGEALNLARTAGRNFHTALTNGLALGKSFEELCAEANVTRVDLPAFAASTQAPLEGLPPQINLRLIQRQADELKSGEVTPFLTSTDGGYVLHVKERRPVEESVLQAELPGFMANLRQYRLGQAFDLWFRKQAESARLSPPQREPDLSSQPPQGGTPVPVNIPSGS